LCCTVHRKTAAREGCLQRDVSCRDNLRCGNDGLTDNPATVLGDIVFDRLFPTKGLLRINVNLSTIWSTSLAMDLFQNGATDDHDPRFFDFRDPFVRQSFLQLVVVNAWDRL